MTTNKIASNDAVPSTQSIGVNSSISVNDYLLEHVFTPKEKFDGVTDVTPTDEQEREFFGELFTDNEGKLAELYPELFSREVISLKVAGKSLPPYKRFLLAVNLLNEQVQYYSEEAYDFCKMEGLDQAVNAGKPYVVFENLS